MAIDPNNRPIRVINDDTTNEEMEAGHHIPNADPPKNEAARGGFGNRDGKEGFGSDTSGGATALGVNENADDMAPPRDNMRSEDEGRPDRPNQDMPAEDDSPPPSCPAAAPWTNSMPTTAAPASTKCSTPTPAWAWARWSPSPSSPSPAPTPTPN